MKLDEIRKLAKACPLDGLPRAVLFELLTHVDAEPVIWPSQETIGDIIGFKVRAIRNALKALEDAGVIARTGRRKYGATEYRIDTEKLAERAARDAAHDRHEMPPAPNAAGTRCRPDRHEVPVQPARDAAKGKGRERKRKSRDFVATRASAPDADAENPADAFELTAPEPEPSPTKPHHCPTDWTPTPEDRAMARNLGLTDEEIDDETAEFRGYWSAQRGQRAKRPGWSATWRGRIRERAQRLGAHRRVNGAGGGMARQPVTDASRRPTSIASAAIRLLDQHPDRKPVPADWGPAGDPGSGDCDAELAHGGVFRVVGE